MLDTRTFNRTRFRLINISETFFVPCTIIYLVSRKMASGNLVHMRTSHRTLKIKTIFQSFKKIEINTWM
jgi:hypothetical protein